MKGWDHPCPHQALTQHRLWRDVEGARWLRLQGCRQGSALGLETLMPMEGGGLSFSSEPRFEPPVRQEGVGSCTLPSTLELCHAATHHPQHLPRASSFPGASSLQGLLRGTATSACQGSNPDPGSRELLFGFSPFPPATATGVVFPAVGRGQLLATGIAQGCGEALQGARPRAGVVRASHAQLPALLGQRMQKARVCCWHRFPSTALQPPGQSGSPSKQPAWHPAPWLGWALPPLG